VLARANRRLYQQGRAYDFRLKLANVDSTTERNYEIYTLSNAWWVKKSIEFAKAVYVNATKDEKTLLGSRKAKWNDFVIHTGTTGAVSNFANLFQYSPATSGDDMTAAEVTGDETLYEVVGQNSEVEGDHDLGNDYDYGFTIEAEDMTGSVRNYNIFEQYMLTRQHVTPQDTRAGPYSDLIDIDEVAMKNMKEAGDQAPFDLDTFPSPWVLADTIHVDQLMSPTSLYSKTITAPLGIVIVKKLTSSGDERTFVDGDNFILEVKKGKYKGVHAPAYRAAMELC
jgi:chitodextrinase